MRRLNKILKTLLKSIIILICLILILVIIFKISTKLNPPVIENTEVENLQATQIDSSFSYIKNNWLKKNDFGLWEMYIEGEAYERGIINGKLSKDLIYKQEDAFVNQIKTMIAELPTIETAKELGLLPEEYDKIVEILGRKPNFTELSIYSVMWSEHCSYKNSIHWLKKLPKEI